jgi:hypothetical protein
MKYRALLGGMAAVAGAVLALGACGNPIARLTTERAIGNAVSKELAQPGLNLQISLAVTPDQLIQINQKEHGKSSLTPDEASALSKTSIVINVDPGQGESLRSKQFASDPNNRYELALQVGNARPVDVRYLNGTLYARAQLDTLATDFGGKMSAATSAKDALNQADHYVPGLAALGNGDWVSADLKALAPLLKPAASNRTKTATSEGDARTLLNHIGSALTSHTSYVNLGDHGGRTEYQLTVQAHDFLQSLSSTLPDDISRIAGDASIPGASSVASQVKKALDQALAEVPPHQTVNIQLWVKDNMAQEIDVDINQFLHEFQFPVPVRFLLGPGTPVTAPSNATPLDFSKVSGLLGGMLGGLGGSSAGAVPARA